MAFVSTPSTSNNDDVSTVFEKTGKKIIINGSDTAGYNKAKVEYFNCHKMGHFARECRVLRNQENRTRNQEITRRTVNVEVLSSKSMVAIDGAGFDWSYMADDEAPTNMAFMAFSDSEDILIQGSEIAVLKSKLEKISKEKYDIEIKIEKIENASQSLDKLIGSQITAKSKRGLGYVSYNAVLPSHTGMFSPPRINLSYTGLPEFAKPSVETYGVKPVKVVTQTSSVKISKPVKENNDAPFIEDWESKGEDEDESPPKIKRKNVEPSVNKVKIDIPKQNDKPARRPVKYAEMYRTQRPREALIICRLGANTIRGNGWGCSRHMTGNISYLIDFKEFNRGYVAFEGGTKGGKITVKGIIKIGKLDFKDVYFVKELKFNFFSVSHMCDKKNSILFTDTECFVLSPDFKLADESHVLLKVPKKNNMYSVDMKNIVPKKDFTCLVAKATNDESMLWHRRLGHINFKNINELVKKNLVRATKDETSRILKSFVTEIENLVDKKVKIIRCDNGTKFKNRVMNKFCEEKGIKREYSVARTPQQNRVAEKRNKTLIENRVLVVKPHFKTPYKLFRGRTPALSFMRPFGCHVIILNTLDHLENFDGKSNEEFFVGYSTNSKAFRVYNTKTRKVEENLHINFLKNKPIIAGDRPKWLLDIDAITKSMNYVPVIADGDNKDNDGPCKESEIDNQERPNAENSTKDVNTGGPSINTASSNINTASLIVNTVRLSDDFFGADNDIRSLDGVEVDISNISTTYPMDVKSVFLYERIEEEVYVCQPSGFDDPDYPEKVYKVEKALYGLHQALRDCMKLWPSIFWTMDFTEARLIKPCSSRDKKRIFCLYKYVKPTSTPMDKEKALLKDSDGDDVDVYFYRFMIGSLMYLTSSRPDIMFAMRPSLRRCMMDWGGLPTTAFSLEAEQGSDNVTTLENELKSTKAVYNKDEEASLDKVDSPKQGRMIEEINEDENINLVKSSKQWEAHETTRYRKESDYTNFSTASPQKDDDEITLAETLVNIKKSAAKDKGKAIMHKSEPLKKIKKKEMIHISLDEEIAQRFYEEEQSQLLMDEEYAQQVQAQWNGDHPLPVLAQVSLAGIAQNAIPTLKYPNNKTAKDLCDALERQMRGSEYGEQDRKVVILYECETFKATKEEQLLDTYLRYLQYSTLMRQTKNLMDINIDALYNILKKNKGDMNDALGYKKKAVMVTSHPLALVAEKTKVSKQKKKVKVQSESKGSDDEDKPSSSANKKPEYVKSMEKKEDKKDDEKKRDMSKVKCYNCKKEGHFTKDYKKSKVKDYNYYKIKMLLAKKDSDEQVLLVEDQA
uniref:Integrase catalytic domain-containing protein n=1 Tax=Tanacetum cinerariifolium TaxID=118510 RepID=A0A6L2NV91_TANCI|nr:hypothetical protein [Tanacetum cinerariifolium]